MAPPRIPLDERLERYTDKSGGPDTCWLWTGVIRHKGRGVRGTYGCINIGGKQTVVSRLMYERAYGPIPHGMLVCHRCDVPRCVNPTHLFLGTPKENMQDRDAKGRHARCAPKRIRRGEANNLARFTEEQVRHIRHLRESGWTYSQLMSIYPMSKANMSEICNRLTWTHVA